MKSAALLTILASGVAAATEATLDSSSGDWKGQYRISPLDGSKIALPKRAQLDFQKREIGFLIHFNIATFIEPDGCNWDPTLVPDKSIFNPALFNIEQWMESAKAVGAKYATLVAKHNCGFTTWPTKAQFVDRNGTKQSYNYNIDQSPYKGHNIVSAFSQAARKHGLGHGFYYSSVVNNYLNVQSSEARNGSLSNGQVGITTETYTDIVLAQLRELWTENGELTEIWFDGGYSGSQKGPIQKLLQETQSNAVIFNGCDDKGTCLTDKPLRWVGTEKGVAPVDTWSSGLVDGGDPTSPFFNPAECDTSLQLQGRWFWGQTTGLRSFKEMVDVYHQTVGRNCVLALDLAPDRTGLVPADAAARYKQLGDFIRSCYDDPVPSKEVKSQVWGEYRMTFDKPSVIDRIVMMEDQTNGQVIRGYNVYAKIIDSDGINTATDVPWTQVSGGKSIGHKRIDIFDNPITVTDVMVNSTYVDEPNFESVEVHLCDRF